MVGRLLGWSLRVKDGMESRLVGLGGLIGIGNSGVLLGSWEFILVSCFFVVSKYVAYFWLGGF